MSQAYYVAERVTEPRETALSSWVSRELADEVARVARLNERSISAEIRLALRRHLAVEGDRHQ